MTKSEPIDRLAQRLGSHPAWAGKVTSKRVRRSMVSATIEAMIDEVGDALQQHVPVRISRLGTLIPELKKNRKMRDFKNKTFSYGTLMVLKFNPSEQLVHRMRSKSMEKYAVVTEDPKPVKPGEKQAGVKNDQASRNSNVPISNSQGTQPWEKKRDEPAKK